MNFVPGRPGFYEEILTSNRGMSSSPSTASSTSSSCLLQHKGHLPLYNYHHGLVTESQNPANNEADNNNDSDDHMFPRCEGRGEGTSGGSASMAIEREHMFDKVVTPSDVGKLNRLVIPKQHAEKYFPLDSSTNEKGLLLNFEDRNGKPWRFRYSYWNSSQSYVMTKGWSRFVKEKKLDAGDIVSFQRGVGDSYKDRLFIDWRRRLDAPDLTAHIPTLSIPHQFSFQRTGGDTTLHHHHHPWSYNPLFLSRDYSHQLLHSGNSSNATTSAHHHNQNHGGGGYGGLAYGGGYSNVVDGKPCPPGSLVYLRSGGGVYAPQPQQQVSVVHAQALALAQQRGGERMVYESVPGVQGKAAAKRLRLFGVNMDCPISNTSDSSPDHHECDANNSITLPLIHQIHQYQYQYPANFEHQLPSSNPSASAVPSLQLGPNYNLSDDNDDVDVDDDEDEDDKGKGSMSLDLDI